MEPIEIFILTPHSSRIAELFYAAEEKLLIAKFQKGGVYQYNKVTLKAFKNLIDPESVGKAFNKIASNPEKYPYKKIGEMSYVRLLKSRGIRV